MTTNKLKLTFFIALILFSWAAVGQSVIKLETSHIEYDPSEMVDVWASQVAIRNILPLPSFPLVKQVIQTTSSKSALIETEFSFNYQNQTLIVKNEDRSEKKVSVKKRTISGGISKVLKRDKNNLVLVSDESVSLVAQNSGNVVKQIQLNSKPSAAKVLYDQNLIAVPDDKQTSILNTSTFELLTIQAQNVISISKINNDVVAVLEKSTDQKKYKLQFISLTNNTLQNNKINDVYFDEQPLLVSRQNQLLIAAGNSLKLLEFGGSWNNSCINFSSDIGLIKQSDDLLVIYLQNGQMVQLGSNMEIQAFPNEKTQPFEGGEFGDNGSWIVFSSYLNVLNFDFSSRLKPGQSITYGNEAVKSLCGVDYQEAIIRQIACWSPVVGTVYDIKNVELAYLNPAFFLSFLTNQKTNQTLHLADIGSNLSC